MVSKMGALKMMRKASSVAQNAAGYIALDVAYAAEYGEGFFTHPHPLPLSRGERGNSFARPHLWPLSQRERGVRRELGLQLDAQDRPDFAVIRPGGRLAIDADLPGSRVNYQRRLMVIAGVSFNVRKPDHVEQLASAVIRPGGLQLRVVGVLRRDDYR